MTNKITDAHLNSLCDTLNILTDSPSTPYKPNKEGKLIACPGNFHISHAYGGVCLQRIHNEGGAVSNPLSSGHITKRALYNEMQAMIRGIELVQKGTIK